MNKGDLIDRIAERTQLKKAEATDALNAIIAIVSDALKQGDKVTLVGFGSFDVSYRASRKGINPSTQKEINIEDKVSVKFKAGKELSTAVDNKGLKDTLKKAQKASKPEAKAEKAPKAEKAKKETKEKTEKKKK
jgi:DNA-binding protein HU-beta